MKRSLAKGYIYKQQRVWGGGGNNNNTSSNISSSSSNASGLLYSADVGGGGYGGTVGMKVMSIIAVGQTLDCEVEDEKWNALYHGLQVLVNYWRFAEQQRVQNIKYAINNRTIEKRRENERNKERI